MIHSLIGRHIVAPQRLASVTRQHRSGAGLRLVDFDVFLDRVDQAFAHIVGSHGRIRDLPQ